MGASTSDSSAATGSCSAIRVTTAIRTRKGRWKSVRPGAKLEIYRRTGIQFMRINSLFQLFALKRARSPILESAEAFLMIADLLHYWLTGIKVVEYTNASTTQMLDPFARTWASDVVRKLGLPDRILGTVIQPGTVLGPLRPSVVRQTGLAPIPVVAPATHDTGAAVAAVPARGDSWAFISSGTWSLMGTETREPITSEKASGTTSRTKEASPARPGSSRTSWGCGSSRNAGVSGRRRESTTPTTS